jgi:hypothetical protein
MPQRRRAPEIEKSSSQKVMPARTAARQPGLRGKFKSPRVRGSHLRADSF